MGFFNRKKNTESSSALSESEIQKKLYGEFSEGGPHVAVGEREHFKAPAPAKGVPSEKDAAEDLFSVQKNVLSEPKFSPRPVASEQKSDEQKSHPALPRDFIKRPEASPDVRVRYPYHRPPEKQGLSFLDLWNGFFENAGNLLRIFFAPEQVAIRRFFYWGTAVLVVALLFWGVNALNSQREEAMRVRYKIPGETPAKTRPAAPAAVSKRVTERPVVITPAAKPVKARLPEGNRVSSIPVNGPYVIQVVTYPSQQDAEQIVETFRRDGFRAFVKENMRPSGRVFYVVLLGGFRSEAEAQAQLLKFRSKEVARPFPDAFVKSSRS